MIIRQANHLALLVATVLALGISFSSQAAIAKGGDLRVATVDMQRAIQTVSEGKKARKSLETAFNKKKRELQKEEAEIKKLHEELKKQSLAMNEKALGQKQAEIQKRVMALQEKTARSQMEIQRREQELTKPIVERLRKVISGMAKKRGYSLVLERNENNVLYSLAKDDLTEEVIKGYNKK